MEALLACRALSLVHHRPAAIDPPKKIRSLSENPRKRCKTDRTPRICRLAGVSCGCYCPATSWFASKSAPVLHLRPLRRSKVCDPSGQPLEHALVPGPELLQPRPNGSCSDEIHDADHDNYLKLIIYTLYIVNKSR